MLTKQLLLFPEFVAELFATGNCLLWNINVWKLLVRTLQKFWAFYISKHMNIFISHLTKWLMLLSKNNQSRFDIIKKQIKRVFLRMFNLLDLTETSYLWSRNGSPSKLIKRTLERANQAWIGLVYRTPIIRTGERNWNDSSRKYSEIKKKG